MNAVKGIISLHYEYSSIHWPSQRISMTWRKGKIIMGGYVKYIRVRFNPFWRLVRGTRNSIKSTWEVIGSTVFLDYTDKVNNIPAVGSPSQSLQQLPYKNRLFHFRLNFLRLRRKRALSKFQSNPRCIKFLFKGAKYDNQPGKTR